MWRIFISFVQRFTNFKPIEIFVIILHSDNPNSLWNERFGYPFLLSSEINSATANDLSSSDLVVFMNRDFYLFFNVKDQNVKFAIF